MKLKTFTTSPMFLPVVLILVLLIFLAGCGAHTPAKGEFEETPVTVTPIVIVECGQPPPITPVKMRDVTWDIIELDDVDLYTITVEDYQALGMNVSDWLKASKEMKLQRDFYKECVDRSSAD